MGFESGSITFRMFYVPKGLPENCIDVRYIPSTSFSPECDVAVASDNIGQDFLTWLWFFSEARGGIMNNRWQPL